MLPFDALSTFLLVFPALFSIVNPIAGAFIFHEATKFRAEDDQALLARKVALYSLIVMLVAMWGGSVVLNLFGISIAALRIAGGLVVSLWAWSILSAPEAREERKRGEAAPAAEGDDVAFFPLTLPFTTGPGTIAVAIALGSSRPSGEALIPYMIGATAATLAMAVSIWLGYLYAGRIAGLLGPSGSRTLTRLSAFLLLAVGVQITIAGVTDVLAPLLAARR
ncbi:MarC family protein [Elioraea sp.]|uniref:MarC family protein n=1 Tax=Elioraea sp. TaxID=2185103 RepID=UPI0025C2281E|nr:MarC family protein [Elioraea sp.]